MLQRCAIGLYNKRRIDVITLFLGIFLPLERRTQGVGSPSLLNTHTNTPVASFTCGATMPFIPAPRRGGRKRHDTSRLCKGGNHLANTREAAAGVDLGERRREGNHNTPTTQRLRSEGVLLLIYKKAPHMACGTRHKDYSAAAPRQPVCRHDRHHYRHHRCDPVFSTNK